MTTIVLQEQEITGILQEPEIIASVVPVEIVTFADLVITFFDSSDVEQDVTFFDSGDVEQDLTIQDPVRT